MFKLKILFFFISIFSYAAIADGTYDDSVIAIDRSLDPMERSMRARDHGLLSQADDVVIDLSNSSPERNNQVELTIQEINKELEAARKVRAEAERLRDEGSLIARKRAEAHKGILTSTTAIQSINPTEIMTQQVSFDSKYPLTISQIVTSLMPPNWDVRTDFHNNPEIGKRKYSFVSTKSRDLAIRKLLSEVSGARVTHHYMWDLVDENGNPKPVIIITDKK